MTRHTLRYLHPLRFLPSVRKGVYCLEENEVVTSSLRSGARGVRAVRQSRLRPIGPTGTAEPAYFAQTCLRVLRLRKAHLRGIPEQG